MIENVFIILGQLTKSGLTILKILIRSKLSLKKYKIDTEDNCIVLGNGPSLKKVLSEHLDFLKSKTVLCVNNFPATEAYEQVKPRFFIFTSIEFWKKGAIQKDQDVRDNIIKCVVEKTDWPLILFCPYGASTNKAFINNIKENRNIKIYYFNNTPVEGLSKLSFFFMKRGWGMPRPHNVLIPAIYNLINAKFNKIYLLGADHSWIPLISVNDNNEAMVNQKHFYDEESSNSEKMHKNDRPRKLYEILEKFMLAFKAYFVLDEYAKLNDVKVINATPHSFIDAFKREELFPIIKITKINSDV